MGNLLSICIKIDVVSDDDDNISPDNYKSPDNYNSPKCNEYRFQAPIKTRSVSPIRPNKFENINLN